MRPRRARRDAAVLAFVRGNVPDDSANVAIPERANGQNIHGHNLGFGTTHFGSNLRPTSGGGTQIQNDLGIVQNGILTTDLTEFKGRTTSKALFFGH